jgi:hypothetical protein
MWFVRLSYRFVATGTWCRVRNTPVVWDINAVLLSEWYFFVRILAHILEECLAHFPLHVPLHFFFRPCLHEPRTDTAHFVVHQQLIKVGVGWGEFTGMAFILKTVVLLEVPVFVSNSMLWFMCVFLVSAFISMKAEGLGWVDPLLRGVLQVVF